MSELSHCAASWFIHQSGFSEIANLLTGAVLLGDTTQERSSPPGVSPYIYNGLTTPTDPPID
jgi:hypothetical protein